MINIRKGKEDGKGKRGMSPRNLRREKVYSVWVGGGEVNDYLLTKEKAIELSAKWKSDGYYPVISKK